MLTHCYFNHEVEQAKTDSVHIELWFKRLSRFVSGKSSFDCTVPSALFWPFWGQVCSYIIIRAENHTLNIPGKETWSWDNLNLYIGSVFSNIPYVACKKWQILIVSEYYDFYTFYLFGVIKCSKGFIFTTFELDH